MRIVKGTERHVDTCLRIAIGLPEFFTATAIENMRKHFREHEFSVAIQKEEVVGFIVIQRRYPEAAEVSWIAVSRNRWDQGIGRQLVNYVADYLKKEGVKLLQVKTLSEEKEYGPYVRTRAFYRSMGFFPLETIEPYPGWDSDTPCLISVKIL